MANRNARDRRAEMTELGLAGLAPFWLAAVALWTAPFITSMNFALTMHSMALVYGAVIASYLAGIGAGGLIAGARPSNEPLLPGMVATLLAWIAAWTIWPFDLHLGAAWRHLLILFVLIYLLFRDLRAVAAGALPSWYGSLRVRLTFWAGLAILAIASRLILIGYI